MMVWRCKHTYGSINSWNYKGIRRGKGGGYRKLHAGILPVSWHYPYTSPALDGRFASAAEDAQSFKAEGKSRLLLFVFTIDTDQMTPWGLLLPLLAFL